MKTADKEVKSKHLAAAFIVIVSIVLLCFYPTIYNSLLQWDDEGYILQNPSIRELNFNTVRWAFTTFYVNYWAPLTWLSLALDYAVWGINPAGYHLTNNIIHAFNSGFCFWLIFILIRNYVDYRGKEDVNSTSITVTSGFYCAILAALLYALHPLRVQSVAWATERKDVLSAFWGLLALIAYFYYATGRLQIGSSKTGLSNYFTKHYLFALLFFVLSLLSKSLLVVLPAALVLIDWFPLNRFSTQKISVVIFEKLPFVFFSFIASILTLRSQGGSVMSFEQTNFISRFFIACKSVISYLYMTLSPFKISPFYVHPGRSFNSIGLEQILPALLCLFITICCIAVAQKYRVILASWLFFLITIFPVLGFSQSGPEGMAARFTYVAGMALAFIISLGFTKFILVFAQSKRNLAIAAIAALSILSTYWLITRRDISVWENDIALWNRVIELNPSGTGRAYYQRSYAYMVAGDYAKALTDVNEAYRIAASKNYNRMYDIELQRGMILKQLGDFEAAIASYSRAIELDSSSNRYMYMQERGKLYQHIGRNDLADIDFQQSNNPFNAQTNR